MQTNLKLKLRNLSDKEFGIEFKNKVQLERDVTSEVVAYIAEADQRKYFLKFGYPSLLEFLMKDMKYSFGAAQRRIDAARISQHVEDLPEKLQSGEITLNQVTLVAQGLRQAKKEQSDFTATAAVRKELIEKVQTLSYNEAQKAVAETLNLEIKTAEKKIVQRDESVRVEMTLSKEEAQLIEELKELLSHTRPNASTKEVLLYAALELKKRIHPAEKQKRVDERRAKSNAAEAVKSVKPTATVAVKTSEAEKRRKVLLNANGCQWQHGNGQICGSRFKLQIDHRHSKWLGGSDEASNLQVLCSAHNRLKYQQEIMLF